MNKKEIKIEIYIYIFLNKKKIHFIVNKIPHLTVKIKDQNAGFVQSDLNLRRSQNVP